MRDAGLVGAVQRDGDLIVAVLIAVNAWGDVAGSPEAALPEPPIPRVGGGDARDPGSAFGSDTGGAVGPSGNTTIGVVGTNAAVDKAVCQHMARGAHDGLARAISPPHASVDGDAFVALATGEVAAGQDQLRWMVVKAVEEAIRSVGMPH
jgi:L-aminopeptidase/D-esterase-like protein